MTNATTVDHQAVPAPVEPPKPSPLLMVKLSAMMFLEFAIQGAWLPLLFPFFKYHRSFPDAQVGYLGAIGAIGAIASPLVAGQLADRKMNAERVLGISHILGALLVFRMAYATNFTELMIEAFLYGLLYTPTLALVNAISFRHLPDRDRDFGKVRVWGTIGWIVIGIAVGQWLFRQHTPNAADVRTIWSAAETTPQPPGEFAERVSSAVRAGVRNEDPTLDADLSADAAQGLLGRAVRGAAALTEYLATRWDYPRERAEAAATRAATAYVVDYLIWRRSGDERPADQSNRFAMNRMVDFAQQPLQHRGMADAFRLSALIGLLFGVYSFFLPRTPPEIVATPSRRTSDDPLRDGERALDYAPAAKSKFAPGEAMVEIARRRPLLVLFILAFPIATVHSLFFARAAEYLGSGRVQLPNPDFINNIFGVGGAGLMTIGQMSEVIVLALMPFFAKRFSKKVLLTVGLLAYAARFFAFAYLPYGWAILPALALHGLVFGCFFFLVFMIIDEHTTKDVTASAQNLFNFIIFGVGVIAGNTLAGWIGEASTVGGAMNWTRFMSIPMWITLACLIAFWIFYPNRSRIPNKEGLAAA